MRARLTLLLALALSICTFASPATAATPRAGSATFHVQPSVEQVAVTRAAPGATASLDNATGDTIGHDVVDRQGSVLFRNVAVGSGYVVTVNGTRSAPVRVVGPDTKPPASLYSSQHLDDGVGYLETRDGTTLSIDVHLPGPASAGPYPTVLEYSGYDMSDFGSHIASTIAQLLGFATVRVNLRGTGCSGGAWDFFEPLQSLDGYDAVETVAAQPWVANHKVGMVGISYPGITQLFVAQTRPPHLAAITPLAAFDDPYATLYPGGIFNDGFALNWAEQQQAGARPANGRWAKERIAGADTTCEQNQALRLQSADVLTLIRRNRYATPAAARLAPATFVHKIDVPVFLAGSWQDEETGSHFADMLDRFAPGVPVRVTLMNGNHGDAIGPAVLSRWAEFLDFFVARTIPAISPATRTVAAGLLSQFYGPGVALAPDRFTDQRDFATALATYRAEPPVQILFDVGAGGAPGTPVPAFSATAHSWPLPGTIATSYYLSAHGALTTDRPAASTGSKGDDNYAYDPGAFPKTSQRTAGPNGALSPSYSWKPVPAGKALGYVSTPLAANTVMAGTGSVDLWFRSSAPDVDLEVTLSEVRPDGQETYVQSGWLRASQRKVDPAASNALLPVPTHAEADASPLPRDKYTLVRVPLYPFAHAFRAGSQIRIVVQPPGGNRPLWAFDTVRPKPPVTNSIARSHAQPSKVVLPVVPGIAVTTPLPQCGTLRGQPCRAYVPAANGGPS